MRRIVLTACAALTCLTSAFSQEVRKLGLKECVNIALENNLRIKRSVYNVETFKANMMQAKGSFLPTVNAGGSYNMNFGRALNPVSNLYVDKNSTTLNPNLQASWTIFNGLRIQNTFRQNQRDVAAADQDLQKTKNDLIINVVTLYTNVIFNQELLDNANYQLNSSQQQLERIKKQVAAGALSVSNQLNQEAQVATNEVNAINQENALNLSLLQLKQAMQVPGTEQFQVIVPDLALEDLLLDQSAQEIYQMALENMPEIKSAQLKVESAENSLKATRGNYYPRLSLNGSMATNYSSVSNKDRLVADGTYVVAPLATGITSGGQEVYPYQFGTTLVPEKYEVKAQLSDNLFKSLSLQLSIPILNGFQTRASVQRSIINRELADVTMKETQNTLRQTIESAYNDAVAASRTYASSLKQVKAQEEAYRMNQQRFDVGALSFIEYRVSENDLFRAKSDLTRAKYNFIFKKKVLDFYQGKQIEY